MDNLKFTCDTDKLISELFEQNLSLQAQVTALSSVFLAVISDQKGKAAADKMLELLGKQGLEILYKLIENNEYFAEPWKEYLKEKLINDLPGISLSDPDPDDK
jgi:hypothetical protein